LKATLKGSIKSKVNEPSDVWSEGENAEQLSQQLDPKQVQVELNRIKENVKWVIEENEALRRGMHEILDCIHKQDGKLICIFPT
jgi:hypothetical protein